MRLLGVHRLRGTFAIEAASCLDDDGALALHQSFWSGVSIAEGHACPQYVIEPSLQGGRYSEVVHGRPDDNDIRGAQLSDELVRQCQSGGLRGIHRFRAAQYGSGVHAQMGNRTAAKVAQDDPDVRVFRLQLSDSLAHELIGCGSYSECAARENENRRHEMNVLCMLVKAMEAR